MIYLSLFLLLYKSLEWVELTGGSFGLVGAVIIVDEPQTMYNLTIALAHTFVVGENGWVVHNKSKYYCDFQQRAADASELLTKGFHINVFPTNSQRRIGELSIVPATSGILIDIGPFSRTKKMYVNFHKDIINSADSLFRRDSTEVIAQANYMREALEHLGADHHRVQQATRLIEIFQADPLEFMLRPGLLWK